MQPFVLRSEKKDLVNYVSKFGKGIKNIFKTRKKTNEVDLYKHGMFSYGFVYANNLAKPQIEKDKPIFPVGSIIVREKNETDVSEVPEVVIAMIKREKGFSEKTGDWEFLTFNGKDLQMQNRETVGNCATCHSNAKQTDWVFREYLKQTK